MTLAVLLLVISGILMGISAFVTPPRVSLTTIAWALFIFGIAAWIAGSNVAIK